MGENDSDKSNGEARRESPGIVQLGMTLLVSWAGLAVCVGAFLLTGGAFILWAVTTVQEFLLTESHGPKDYIHNLLLSIEMLLLVPLPAIIGVVVYQTLRNVSDLRDPHLEKSHEQVSAAKNILAGFLITVTGTTLLDFLASEKAELQPFIGGFMLMLGLVAYLYVTRES